MVLFQRLDVVNNGREIQSNGFTDGLQRGVADLTLRKHLEENQGEMVDMTDNYGRSNMTIHSWIHDRFDGGFSPWESFFCEEKSS